MTPFDLIDRAVIQITQHVSCNVRISIKYEKIEEKLPTFTHNVSNWLYMYKLYILRIMSNDESLTDQKCVQNINRIYHCVGQE